jgi:hypothetical protein
MTLQTDFTADLFVYLPGRLMTQCVCLTTSESSRYIGLPGIQQPLQQTESEKDLD